MTLLKGGLRAAFFFLGLAWAWAHADTQIPASVHLQQRATALQLAQHPQWAALLHHDGTRAHIQDPEFLLSAPRFSLDEELRLTLQKLYDGPSDAVCRFPARYFWLQQQLDAPPLAIDRCKELTEFATQAPMEEVSLVYASEVLSMPSSMMGHLFLKVRGRHADGATREHAVSFFTEPVTWNLPKLFYDSLIGGMQGYFSLTPFQQEAELYIGKEGRNLWIYPLRLDGSGRQLLQAHIIELKHVGFTYYFQHYNCATLVKHLLAINRPEVLTTPEWWTTPRDVVRAAARHELVDAPTALTAARWTLRILQDDLTATEVARVKEAVEASRIPPSTAASDRDYLALKGAQALNLYLYETDQRSRAAWASYAKALQQAEHATFADWALESSQRRDPVTGQPDTQWAFGVMQRQGDTRLYAEILPASHKLEDDNSLYFAESALTLFNLAASTSLEGRGAKLERAVIYGVESLLPRDPLTGGWSGRFRLGWDQLRDGQLKERGAWLVEGGLGATSRVHRDIDLYALAVAGASPARRGHLYVKPEIGAVIRQVYGMKTVARVAVGHNELNSGRSFVSRELTQTKRFANGITLMLHHRDARGSHQRSREAGVRIKYLF